MRGRAAISALSFPLCAEWLATTVHRLGVDASGNPGFTAGRGFNPAGGAPVGDNGRSGSRPRPETRLLHQPAREGLTNLSRTESPRHADRNKSDHEVTGGGAAATAAAARLMERRCGGYRD
ncbi:hypothetical protein F511_09200 [Dorcoceras hygrometricum]|uniref:Uncharacterized protein n=1 Tax=Dorcoceras hygrometricum TaxID=472368 RepID=A0A2Z7ATK4_9LAMI|nr:hypothetical protein F511_09200 [Dorcoceras hygrometricum]